MYISDGNTVRVVAPAGGCVKDGFYRVSGFNGFALADAVAGAEVVLVIKPREVHQFAVPGALTANKGDVLYIPTASTGVAALTATAAGNIPAVKVTATKDGANLIWGYAIND
jgi:hypothetical protein